MEYPYDEPSFSPFLKAFLEVLRERPTLAEPVDDFLRLLDTGIDRPAQSLLHTLAYHARPRTDLAWRSFYYYGDDSEGLDQELLGAWEDYNVFDEHPGRFNPEKGFLLGESAGGEVYFGFHVDGGSLKFFEVDTEDELGEPIKLFETADDFWAHIQESEYEWGESEGEERPELMAKLWAAAGQELNWPD